MKQSENQTRQLKKLHIDKILNDLSKSNYILQAAEKSACPVCRGNIDLLCNDDRPIAWFYICWTCRKIFHVGRSEVLRGA